MRDVRACKCPKCGCFSKKFGSGCLLDFYECSSCGCVFQFCKGCGSKEVLDWWKK